MIKVSEESERNVLVLEAQSKLTDQDYKDVLIPRLETIIRERQRLLQQRIVAQINLADRQIVGGATVGIHPVEQFRERVFVFMVPFSFFQLRPRTRQTVSAIMCSSSVRMTRTASRVAAAEIKPFTRKVASGSPIRSIPPSRIRPSESPASNSAT